MLFFRKLSRRTLVFLVALFTTFSTTAYLAVGVFFLLYYLLVDNKAERLVIILPLLVITIWISLFSLDFLSAKIVDQLASFNEGNVYGSQSENDTRIGSASLDFKDLQRSPLFGTGSSDETRWGPGEQLFMRTNGVTDFLVRMGIVGFTFCLFFMFNAWKKLFQRLENSKPGASAFVLTFTIYFISLGETFFVTVFFWSFFFIQYNNLVFEPEPQPE
jgi:O-antigen ligase